MSRPPELLRRPLLFYTRQGCHLCREGRETLAAILEERAAAGRKTPAVREVDIDEDPELQRRYLELIPVLRVDEHELPLALGGRDMRAFLDRALSSALV